jgi:hypothetical protein
MSISQRQIFSLPFSLGYLKVKNLRKTHHSLTKLLKKEFSLQEFL